MAYTLITKKEFSFAAELVRNLEGANQQVPPALLDLAMQNPRFRKFRDRPGRPGIQNNNNNNGSSNNNSYSMQGVIGGNGTNNSNINRGRGRGRGMLNRGIGWEEEHSSNEPRQFKPTPPDMQPQQGRSSVPPQQ